VENREHQEAAARREHPAHPEPQQLAMRPEHRAAAERQAHPDPPGTEMDHGRQKPVAHPEPQKLPEHRAAAEYQAHPDHLGTEMNPGPLKPEAHPEPQNPVHPEIPSRRTSSA
jgi:hypothetical protein